MTRLLIVRHGNTFGPDDTPTRVGGRTDLPLVESGVKQAEALGQHFGQQEYIPDLVFTSELIRTKQTAEHILKELQIERPMQALEMLNEIDYGPDENKTEEEVIARIGKEAIETWDKEAIVPEGWEFDPDKAVQDWYSLSDTLLKDYQEKTIMIVTSNGIARFAPYLTGDYEGFKSSYKIKLKTGAYGLFEYQHNQWVVLEWGVRP